MANLLIYQVDSFATRPFSGNPAGVCIPEEPLTEAFMQDVALEMNLSETAFLVETGESFGLRWFTPLREVDLCGHATLASAHVLWETGRLALEEQAVFDTRSGRLSSKFSDGDVVMDFPAEPPEMDVEVPTELKHGIDAELVAVGRNRLDYFVVLPSEEVVRTLRPDMTLLSTLGSRGVIVTAESDGPSDYDFVSRYFAPKFGIPEDPVTGSAHCCLAPYWCSALGQSRLVGYQASARGGMVEVRHSGGERVELAGRAVTTAKVELLVSPELAGGV
ncbi:MAG: PhzF family phenazine biosynthesis protein [Rhodothermia bacterium]|nr:PhzF family phenazine biosynthesis protein [Rhodothermia bacterium]